jgi:hypothetical protein
MCYPFGEERKSAARVMTLAARVFCREGFCVVRFDYCGTGESDGCLETVTLGQWVEDIRQARLHLSKETGMSRVGVLGVRFGAALAAITPGDEGPLPFLVLWAPLWSGRSCVEECLRHLAATRLVVGGDREAENGFSDTSGTGGLDMGGFVLGPPLRSELEALELPRDAKVTADAVVVVHFSRQVAVPPEHEAMCRRLTSSTGVGRVVDVPARPFWVTASRYDPQPLVDRTIEALGACRAFESQ